ncbi:MAG TPA: ABC transporter ATP-binding protein [Planctomycetota bacterium]|nr:ABC transporter ATP-binding protein [Planctomycetota bacterium]
MDVRATNLSKSFRSGLETRQILKGAALELSAGDSVAIMGPSGSGKSTLLNILGTLDKPDTGEVEVFGERPFTLPEKALADFRARNIGFVFQLHHLLPQCSLLENVLIPTLAAGISRKSDANETPRTRALRLLERAGLSARMHARPGECSGGECQRAAVVRALINAPRLLLADEPTGSLDKTSAHSLVDLLKDLQKSERLALVVVTHAPEVAQALDRVLRLQDGALVEVERSRL